MWKQIITNKTSKNLDSTFTYKDQETFEYYESYKKLIFILFSHNIMP
jgi:hypothetical protein